MPGPSHRRLRFRAPWVIFWVALGLRLACIFIGHTYRIRLDDNHFDFGFEAGRIARSLVEGHGYGNPFNGPSGPTAWLTPLYPLLMALAFKLFGVYTNGAAIFLMAVDSVASAAIAPAVYEIAARCFDAQGLARRGSTKAAPVALWSAWLWAVYPAALQYAVHWLWEMSISACLLTWALVLALRLRGVGERGGGAEGSGAEPAHDDETVMNGAPSASGPAVARETKSSGELKLWAVLGLLWGLIALSNASLLLVLPASLVWILWPQLRSQARWRAAGRAVAGAVLACVVFAAVLAPWVARNERTMHHFILTRDNLGVELWQSSLFYHDAFPWGTAMPLWPGDPEFKKFVRMGEFDYAQQKEAAAERNLRAHPGLFARYTLQRVEFFWFGTPHGDDHRAWTEFTRMLNYSVLSVVGLLGLGLALLRRVPGAWLLASVFLLVPVAYYVVTVQARFRHPIEPLIAVLGVYLFRSTPPRARAKTTRDVRH